MSLTINSGNDLSTLFSSLNNKSNDSTSGLASILSEYNSIRNGSYLKLAKQYYAKDTTGKNSVLKDEFKDKSSMINDDTKITENKSLISDVSKFRKSLSTVKAMIHYSKRRLIKTKTAMRRWITIMIRFMTGFHLLPKHTTLSLKPAQSLIRQRY